MWVAWLMVITWWVLAALTVTTFWVGYRRFVATHNLEEFDPVEVEAPSASSRLPRRL